MPFLSSEELWAFFTYCAKNFYLFLLLSLYFNLYRYKTTQVEVKEDDPSVVMETRMSLYKSLPSPTTAQMTNQGHPCWCVSWGLLGPEAPQ